jgi:hypothetical protein
MICQRSTTHHLHIFVQKNKEQCNLSNLQS